MPGYHNSLEERIAALETSLQPIQKAIDSLTAKVDGLIVNVSIIIDQRNAADKQLTKWKNAALTLSTGLALALIGWLAKLALIVQSAHAAVSN